ncbi:MAG TPA: STAS/SEC14 domain-containing protein [Rhizomicrobium sp.]|jgi:hypothetical protein|nr:STAS/SEC14 domain-containing protein [Rhizomicrobium sp.]
MLNVLTEFPDDILAVEWQGEVTAEDYRSVLIPAALAKIRQHGHLRMLAVLGPSFETITARAMWEDAKLGFGHLSDFSRIAIVTDIPWIRDSVRLFAPLFRNPVRVFSNADQVTAEAWIVSRDGVSD